jgi:hypothetical protein
MNAPELLPQPPLDHGCEDCGAGPGRDCDPDCRSLAAIILRLEDTCRHCGAPGDRPCKRWCRADSEPCGCWDPLCGECMRRVHDGEARPRPVNGGIRF